MKLSILLCLLVVVAVAYGRDWSTEDENDLTEMLVDTRGFFDTIKSLYRTGKEKIKAAARKAKAKLRRVLKKGKEMFGKMTRKAKALAKKAGRALKNVDWAGVARRVAPFVKSGITKFACSKIAATIVSAAMKKPPTGQMSPVTNMICGRLQSMASAALDAIIERTDKRN